MDTIWEKHWIRRFLFFHMSSDLCCSVFFRSLCFFIKRKRMKYVRCCRNPSNRRSNWFRELFKSIDTISNGFSLTCATATQSMWTYRSSFDDETASSFKNTMKLDWINRARWCNHWKETFYSSSIDLNFEEFCWQRLLLSHSWVLPSNLNSSKPKGDDFQWLFKWIHFVLLSTLSHIEQNIKEEKKDKV